jgi:predicted nucleic-acid-binding protein
MVSLIDTNIIIRFLVGDNEEHLQIATEIFTQVENGEIEVEILDTVIMKALFVLVKFYKLPKSEVIADLKRLIALRGVVGDKVLLMESLNIVNDKNIDFVDALICAKSRLQGYGKLSFDKDVNKKCEG